MPDPTVNPTPLPAVPDAAAPAPQPAQGLDDAKLQQLAQSICDDVQAQPGPQAGGGPHAVGAGLPTGVILALKNFGVEEMKFLIKYIQDHGLAIGLSLLGA